MNEAEGLKVSYAVNELTWILDRDLDETDNRVRLAPTDRSRIDRARTGCIALLRQAQAKAEQKAEAFLALLETAESTDAQGELFDGAGKPLTPADSNGKIPETKRDFPEGEYAEEGSPGWNRELGPEEPILVEGLDVEQVDWSVRPPSEPGQEATESTESDSAEASGPSGEETPSEASMTPLAERIANSILGTKELILTKLDLGLGKTALVKDVAEMRGETKAAVEGYFAELLALGESSGGAEGIVKVGKTYVRAGKTPSEANEQPIRDLAPEAVEKALLEHIGERNGAARFPAIEMVADVLDTHSFQVREAWSRIESTGQIVQDVRGLWVLAAVEVAKSA